MIEMFLTREKLDRKEISDWGELKKNSLNLGYTDLEGAVKDAAQAGTAWPLELPKKLNGWARSTALSTYDTRFLDELDREKPVEEFIALLGLELEVCNHDLNSRSLGAIKSGSLNAIRTAKEKVFAGGKITSKAVKDEASGLSDEEADTIAKALNLAQG